MKNATQAAYATSEDYLAARPGMCTARTVNARHVCTLYDGHKGAHYDSLADVTFRISTLRVVCPHCAHEHIALAPGACPACGYTVAQ